MNTVCNWKTIAVIGIALLAMFEVSQGFAGALNAMEKQYQEDMFKDMSQHDSKITAYWEGELTNQVAQARRQIPIQTGEYVFIIDIQIDTDKRYIIYSYGIITDMPTPDMSPTMNNNKFSEMMCSDPEGRFFLINMKGTLIFKHFTKADTDNSFLTVIVSSDNCQDF